jgi:transposase
MGRWHFDRRRQLGPDRGQPAGNPRRKAARILGGGQHSALGRSLLEIDRDRRRIHFAAWLGLVPKQMSTGDRTILGRISKRGNRYLRTLLMQGARVILLRPANWAKHSFGPWLTAAANRLHHNVLATALANKLARIAWTVLVQARSYEARI